MTTPTPPQPNETRFARLIAQNSFEDEAHEVLLAHVLAYVVCGESRTPTLAERAFIERFIPRVETPIDALAEQDLPSDGLDDLNLGHKKTIMAIALVVATLDGSRGVTAKTVRRVADAIDLPLAEVADAEVTAREFMIEQRFEALYADGMPTSEDRQATFASLRTIGAVDSTLMAWEERYALRTAARPEGDEEHAARFDRQRHATFMSRHDPTSKDHRAPSSVGVFGSK
ncbi:MAG: hypothetical protein ACI9U2_005281 [Bradymonadia bacterium]|jgi:hypothetical protein